MRRIGDAIVRGIPSAVVERGAPKGETRITKLIVRADEVLSFFGFIASPHAHCASIKRSLPIALRGLALSNRRLTMPDRGWGLSRHLICHQYCAPQFPCITRRNTVESWVSAIWLLL